MTTQASKPSTNNKQKIRPKTPASREHPLLSKESPLNRQLLRATGAPDLKALLVMLAHPMADGDIAGLAQRAGGHKVHHDRIKHLRDKALEQHGDRFSSSEGLSKSLGASSHHTMAGLSHGGIGSRGGHPWWNPNRHHTGDWDYGPMPKGHHDIHAPDHPDYTKRRRLLKEIEHKAYVVASAANMPRWTWKLTKRSEDQQQHIKFDAPISELHMKRLRDAWTAATAEHHQSGRDWYPAVFEVCKKWSAETHDPSYTGRPLSPEEIAMMIAVTSPRASWETNVNVVHYSLFGYPLAEIGSDGKKLQTVSMYDEKLQLIKSGSYPSLTSVLSTKKGQPRDLTHDQLMEETPKTYSFWRNIIGKDNEDTATADRHMFAIMGIDIDDREDDMYGYAVRAIRQLAAEKGVDPRVAQAVTWVWYEDHIAPKVKQATIQAVKERKVGNDIYGAHLRQARGHAARSGDEGTMEKVALATRKLQEEEAKLTRANARAAKSAAKGGDVHAKNLLSLAGLHQTVSQRRYTAMRHTKLLALAQRHAGVQKSFRNFLHRNSPNVLLDKRERSGVYRY